MPDGTVVGEGYDESNGTNDLILGVISLLLSRGLQVDYVMELDIEAAMNLAICYNRDIALRRMEFVADVQISIGSLLVKKSGIEEHLDRLTQASKGE